VVLVHGLQVEGLETWTPVAELLSRRGAQVLAVDLRGMGSTLREGAPSQFSVRGQANLLAVVLNELQVREATVAAQGWGCAVALQMAYEQPQFVDRLVLVAPRLVKPWTPWQEKLAGTPYLGKAAIWLTQTGGPVWAVEQRLHFADAGVAAGDYMRRIQGPTHVVGTTAAWETLITAPPDSDLPQALASIPMQTLVLIGEGDGPAAANQVEALLEALPDAEARTIDEAGRYVHIEQASIVARYIDTMRR
jgi:pimeloyl-ACP methyl ester carboxylesterase